MRCNYSCGPLMPASGTKVLKYIRSLSLNMIHELYYSSLAKTLRYFPYCRPFARLIHSVTRSIVQSFTGVFIASLHSFWTNKWTEAPWRPHDVTLLSPCISSLLWRHPADVGRRKLQRTQGHRLAGRWVWGGAQFYTIHGTRQRG